MAFTLQWHLTNACPFSCRHCYITEPHLHLDARDQMKALEKFLAFCRAHTYPPAITLSGGDPLLHPNFYPLYTSIVELGIPVGILGNPIPEQTIERISAIRKPDPYQVSLEGLETANDDIRGAGHYARTMDFLHRARARGWNTHVMLTLTEQNVDDVIPLGEMMRGLVVKFTFNRLCGTGAGANLREVSPKKFHRFLATYNQAAHRLPHLHKKDNLFATIDPRSRGCTGAGCGAAKSFVALLPNGDVYACRKFESKIGNILNESFEECLTSKTARHYQQNSSACASCDLKDRCGACLALLAGRGQSLTTSPDPYCPKHNAIT